MIFQAARTSTEVALPLRRMIHMAALPAEILGSQQIMAKLGNLLAADPNLPPPPTDQTGPNSPPARRDPGCDLVRRGRDQVPRSPPPALPAICWTALARPPSDLHRGVVDWLDVSFQGRTFNLAGLWLRGGLLLKARKVEPIPVNRIPVTGGCRAPMTVPRGDAGAL